MSGTVEQVGISPLSLHFANLKLKYFLLKNYTSKFWFLCIKILSEKNVSYIIQKIILIKNSILFRLEIMLQEKYLQKR